MPLPSPYISCDPIMDGREGTPWDVTGNREYVQKFRVRVTPDDAGRAVDQTTACLCPGLPLPGSFWQPLNGTNPDYNSLLVRMTARNEHGDDWQAWIITCYWSTIMPAGGFPDVPGFSVGPQRDKGTANNPELEPPDLQWDFQVVQKAKEFDLNGKLICNSAGEPLTVPFEDGYSVLTIIRNELYFDAAKAQSWMMTVNSDTYLGYPPETVQVFGLQSRLEFRGPISFNRTQYRLRFKKIKKVGDSRPQETWQPRIVDKGFKHYPDLFGGGPAGKEAVRIMTKDGKPDPQPHYLNGQGALAPKITVNNPHIVLLQGLNPPVPLPDDQQPKIKIPAEPKELTINLYEKRKFKDLLVRGLQ